jgi:transcriptional regulator with XRE-family HTH domain
MSIKAQVDLRTKKLGVLIRDARLASRREMAECAQAIGVKEEVLQAWEEGRLAPSLPELELLAYYLQQPLSQFWGKSARSEGAPATQTMNLPALVGIRQRLIGARLRQQRENASLSLNGLAQQSGLPADRLQAYEMGEHSIPVPILEGLMALIGGQVESLFDQTGTIGKWMAQQKAVQTFLELPPELQDFVSRPINRPYLELALKLSDMSADKLRAIAETLLDITF